MNNDEKRIKLIKFVYSKYLFIGKYYICVYIIVHKYVFSWSNYRFNNFI